MAVRAQTLTALQQARLEVGAFPCLPDAMTVCGLLAGEKDPARPAAPAAQDAAAVPARALQYDGEAGGGAGAAGSAVRARSL